MTHPPAPPFLRYSLEAEIKNRAAHPTTHPAVPNQGLRWVCAVDWKDKPPDGQEKLQVPPRSRGFNNSRGA